MTTATNPAEAFDWHSEYAYSVGVMALIYGFPYVYGAQTRYKWVTQPEDPEHVPYSAVNHFWHAPGVLDASYQDGGCPNNDTLYSVAWVDLSEEPMYKADMNLVPNPADRYSVGDRTPGLVRESDGGIRIVIQNASPGAGREANWLPSPPDGTWFVILRLYRPRASVIDATWRCPPIRKVG